MAANPWAIVTASALSLALVAPACALLAPPSAAHAEGGSSLRFYGTGPGGADRVKIPLGPLADGQITGSYALNVAHDFTLEFWMQASADENLAPDCEANGWYYGNILIDRDVDGAGDYGDYGVALCDQRLAFGVSVADDDRWLLSTLPVTDGQWHHVALTRVDGGALTIFIDGQPAGSREGPAGRIDYRTNRPTSQPNSDPYLVIGAEKHDYPGSFYYSGLIDDLRVSNVARYSAPFPRPGAPLDADSSTVALYRFDEGAGTTVGDSSAADNGPGGGVMIVGGARGGPAWSGDTPFGAAPPQPTASLTGGPTAPPTGEPTARAIAEATPLPTVGSPLEPSPAAPVASALPPQAPVASALPPQATVAATEIVTTPIAPGQDLAPPPEPTTASLPWAFATAAFGMMLAILGILGWRRRMR